MIFIINNILYYILIYIIFFFSILYYFKSLEGCEGDFLICSNKTQIIFYIYRVYDLIISSILFSLVILFQIIIKISFLNFFIYFIIYSIIFYFNQGTDFFKHGTYNFLFFLFICPICFIYIYLIYLFIYFIYYRKNKKIFFFSILILIHIIIYSYMFNCDNFDIGLGGVKIDNNLNDNVCKIIKPKKCGINILDGLFDVSKLLIKNNCAGYSNQQSIFQKYLNNNKKNYKSYYYPRTEHLDIKKSFYNLENFVEKNIEVMNLNKSKDKEIFINFENGKGKIEIKLKKNLTLIKSRGKLAKKNKVKFNNVYIIYIDGISRNHFLRKLKKTSKIIEKMLYSNKDKEKRYKNFNSFQFLKYHVFSEHTIGNNFPFIYGNYMNKNTGISMTKFFKDKGFITASTFNSCNRELFDWSKKQYKKLIFTGWDHENFAMFCDTNFVDKKQKWSITKGKSSIIRKCLYGKDSFEYEFEYILQFLEAYKDERKFFKIGFGDAHEGTMEVVKYIDESLAKFLEIILAKYFDNKTAIILLSDHGAQMAGFHDLLFYNEKLIEKYLAMLFIILPENNENYNKTAISINQQRFITPFDIHDTLLDMINIDKKKFPQMINKGQSLFEEINGLKRNCKNYDQQIPNEFCFCK